MRFSSHSLRFAVLAALTACTHGEPFRTPDFGSDQPAGTAVPTQLTLSASADFDAAWLPDGSGFLYTGDRADVGDVRCVMLLPPDGGRAMRSLCPGASDTFNVFRGSAPFADGRVLFVRQSRLRTAPFPGRQELDVAPLGSMRTPQTLRSIPLTVSGQPTYNAVHQIRWLGPDAIIYRGGYDGAVCDAAALGCGPGTTILVSSGLGIVIEPLDSSLGGPPVFVPGTAQASSVAVSNDGDAIFYTITGQGRVYRLVRSTGVVTIIFDTNGSIARDVQVSGSRLVVVVGGRVRSFVGLGVGPVQSDAGGDLYAVDIGSGAVTVLNPANTYYQHPALSPTGTRLVAESAGDLWLFNLP